MIELLNQRFDRASLTSMGTLPSSFLSMADLNFSNTCKFSFFDGCGGGPIWQCQRGCAQFQKLQLWRLLQIQAGSWQSASFGFSCCLRQRSSGSMQYLLKCGALEELLIRGLESRVWLWASCDLLKLACSEGRRVRGVQCIITLILITPCILERSCPVYLCTIPALSVILVIQDKLLPEVCPPVTPLLCPLSIIQTRMSEQQQLVGYYQQKIDELYRQRLAWLSRFQQCATQLAEKQQLMQSVKTHRDRQGDLRRHIYHHDIALLDENINVVKMQRESIFNEYEDAQQILKMEELVEEFPQQIEKHLPCAAISNNAETIQNQLNIHSANNRSKIPAGKPNASIFREQNSVLSQKDKQKQSKLKYKPTYEELMRRQAAELKTNQEREAVLLQEQLGKLEKTIQLAKRQEATDLGDQREAAAQLQKEQQRQQQRHKQLAQIYFEARKQGKNEREAALGQQAKLKETLQQLQARVAEETRHYQKENKARQTLILRKSEDFQQDYKARMRAKEHNLQALRDNYEKMQDVCIERVQKLEQALTGAKRKLEETERRREETTAQLRAELSELERKEKEQRVEKARVDQQARQKVQAEKRKREQLQERAVKEEQKHKKAQLIEEAYRKGSTGSGKKKQRPNKAGKQHAELSGSEEESSMDISQLQNIKEHINKLEHIIRPKKSK